jgi:cytochrome c556
MTLSKKLNTKKTLTAIALVAGIAGTPAALSHLDSDTFYVSYRQSLFAILGANLGPMSAMIKGEMPWDDAQFRGFADDLATASELDFIRGFPDANQPGKTRAKPEIWENKPDFEAKLNDLREASAALADAASGDDKKAIIAAFQATGGACKSCHDEYKSKDYLN